MLNICPQLPHTGEMGKARLNSSKDDKDGDEGGVGEGKGEGRLVVSSSCESRVGPGCQNINEFLSRCNTSSVQNGRPQRHESQATPEVYGLVLGRNTGKRWPKEKSRDRKGNWGGKQGRRCGLREAGRLRGAAGEQGLCLIQLGIPSAWCRARDMFMALLTVPEWTNWSIPKRKSFPMKESSPSVRVYLYEIDGPLLEFS